MHCRVQDNYPHPDKARHHLRHWRHQRGTGRSYPRDRLGQCLLVRVRNEGAVVIFLADIVRIEIRTCIAIFWAESSAFLRSASTIAALPLTAITATTHQTQSNHYQYETVSVVEQIHVSSRLRPKGL